MTRSIHYTTKGVFRNKSRREINEMCDMENPDYQVIELCKKARYKETVRNNRKIEKLKNLHQEYSMDIRNEERVTCEQ